MESVVDLAGWAYVANPAEWSPNGRWSAYWDSLSALILEFFDAKLDAVTKGTRQYRQSWKTVRMLHILFSVKPFTRQQISLADMSEFYLGALVPDLPPGNNYVWSGNPFAAANPFSTIQRDCKCL